MDGGKARSITGAETDPRATYGVWTNRASTIGIAELSFADTRQILARTNVAGLAAFAARRADDTDLHARSRVLGDRAACDECFVVRLWTRLAHRRF